MAIYLPNVTDYVPQTEAFTPDYKFLNDVLGVRQDRYDSNYKAMNNMYGQVVHADVSRDDSKNSREQYTDKLIPKMHQIAGLDLSLQQNVEAAKGLFAPFYENKNMVRDIVFTKKWKKEMSKADQLRKSEKVENREMYWADGVERLKYAMEDFKNASSDNMMYEQLPEYVEKVNMTKTAIDALLAANNGKGMHAETVTMTPDGRYRITQKDGTALTHKLVGYHMEDDNKTFKKDEAGNKIPIYYSPAENYVNQTALDDPRIQRFYQTKHYVAARRFAQENADKYGGEEQAKRFFYEENMNKYNELLGRTERLEKIEETKAEKAKGNWDDYIKKGGALINGSAEQKRYQAIQNDILAQKNGRVLKNKRIRNIESLGEDFSSKSLEAYMMYSIGMDIKKGASLYANLNASTEWKADEYGLKDYQYQIDLAKIKAKGAQDRKTAKAKAKFDEETSRPKPIIDLELPNASGNSNANVTNYEDFDNHSATETNRNEEWETVKESESHKLKTISAYMEKYHDQFDDVETSGIRVDGKIKTWADLAQEISSAESSEDFSLVDAYYDEIMEIYNKTSEGDNSLNASFSSSDPVFKVIGDNQDNMLELALKDKMADERENEVYNNIYNLLNEKGSIKDLPTSTETSVKMFNDKGERMSRAEFANNMKIQLHSEIEKYGIGTITKDYSGNVVVRDEKLKYLKHTIDFERALLSQNKQLRQQAQGAKQWMASNNKSYQGFRDHFYGDGYVVKNSRSLEPGARGTGGTQRTEKLYSIEDRASVIYDKIDGLMDAHMLSSNATAETSFSRKNFMNNNPNIGVGAEITDYVQGRVTDGFADPVSVEHAKHISSLINGPEGSLNIKFGDKSADWSEMDVDQQQFSSDLVKYVLKDLSRSPESFTDTVTPDVTFRWNPNLGGRSGGGEHGGWVMSFGKDYGKVLYDKFKHSYSSLGADWNGTNAYKMTLFHDKSYNTNISDDPSYADVSIVDFLVNNSENRTGYIENTGGKGVFWKDIDGNLLYKYATGYYDKNTGDVEMGAYTTPIILTGASNSQLNEIYHEYRRVFENNAITIDEEKRKHKKEVEEKNKSKQ